MRILTPLYTTELQSRRYSPPPILTEQMLISKNEKRQEKQPIPSFLNCALDSWKQRITISDENDFIRYAASVFRLHRVEMQGTNIIFIRTC